jgi:hypothetical protein
MPTQPLKSLTLHAYHVGANPGKVAIALEALAIPYAATLWNFGPGPRGAKSGEFLAINPNWRDELGVRRYAQLYPARVRRWA